MKNLEKQEKNQKNYSLYKITWPIFLELLLFILMGNIDIFMLSLYSDYAAPAIAVANQFIEFSVVMFGFISAGSAVIIAQYIGAKKRNEAKRVSGLSILCSIVFGIVVALIFIFFRFELLSIMNLEPIMLEYASTFLLFVGGFIFLQSGISGVYAVLRSYGYTKDTLKVTVAMNILSAVGNAFVLFGLFGMPVLGMFGVAITTTISRGLAFLFALFLMFKHVGNPFKGVFSKIQEKTYFKTNGYYIKSIIKIGIPSAGENLSYNGYLMFLTSIITSMGGVALITHVYSSAINSFLFVITVSIAQGGQIIIGYLMGRKHFDEIYKKCFTYLKIAYIPSLSVAIIMFLFSEPLMRIFTDNIEAISLATTIFGLFILLEVGRVFNVIVISYLRACGDVVFPVVVGIFHMWGVGALLSFIFAVSFDMGLPGIILGMAIEELNRGIIMIFRWRSKKWMEKGLT